MSQQIPRLSDKPPTMLSSVSIFSGVLGAARSALEALQNAMGSVAAPSLNAYASAPAVALAAVLSGSGCAATLEGLAGTTVPIEAPPPRAFVPFGQRTVLQQDRRCLAFHPIDFFPMDFFFQCKNSEAQQLEEAIERRFGVSVEFLTQDMIAGDLGEYRIRATTSCLILRQLRELEAQLRKVPSDFFQLLGLQRIVLTGPINDGNVLAFTDTTAFKAREIFIQDVKRALFQAVSHAFDDINGGVQINCLSYYVDILFNPDMKGDPCWKPVGGVGCLSTAKKDQMRRWLFDWSGGRFNDQYWWDLRAGRVGVDYWR